LNRQTPTLADVDRIAALPDPVVRNLQITQCYHELSTAMASLTGPLANWCTFATWASKQAGQSIRHEDLSRTFEDLLSRSGGAARAIDDLAGAGAETRGLRLPDVDALREALRQALSPSAAFERVGDAIARGNRKVFEEIGREFARFLALCKSGPLDDTRVDEFCTALRPGEPPDGQRYLRQAFRRYAQAVVATDGKARAELMLLANVEIGFHEQTRLQPEIVEALEASLPNLAQLREDLLQALANDGDATRGFWRRPDLDKTRARLARKARELARQAITETLMTLRLPDERVLYLAEDLRGSFPSDLQQIDLPDLQNLLRQIDPTPDSVGESGARDWGDLADRIHFIADMFRIYEEDGSLLAPPFTPDQVATLKAGRRPAGRL
jgi:hypothetical protein